LSLLFFVLSAYGLTQILAFSKILDPIRPKGHFFSCPMCIGFWSGVALLLLNPFTELFTFDVSFANALLLGCLSSGTSYALTMIISDGGIQHEYRVRDNVDKEVDASSGRKVLQG